MVDSLQQRLDQKNDDITKLFDRLNALERRVDVQAEASVRDARATAGIAGQVSGLARQFAENESAVRGKIAVVQEEVKGNGATLAKVRAAQKGVDADVWSLKKWRGDVASEMRQIEMSFSTKMDRSWCHVEQMGKRLDDVVMVGKGGQSDWEKEVEEVRRGLEATTESAAASKSKLKKVEMQVGEALKQAEDMAALNSGFEDGIRDSLLKVTNMIDGLGLSVEQLRKDISVRDKEEEDPALSSRLEAVECNVKSLKKLIESNLRTQWNAESIVKEQVSLITKHVCVAMRQYTARRILENNALIDQALRARVPEYAKNDSQFVLVREEDTDGNESIDIQRSSEVSSTSSS